MNIQQEDNTKKGVFYVEQEGNRIAQMTYVYAGDRQIIIDHTEIDASLSGQGVGYKLVEAAVSFARDKELKILPLCPFAAAVFKKKSEDYKDVKA